MNSLRTLKSLLILKILAHELGHNFGMEHDFEDVHGGQGGPCDGKGIMSYHGGFNKWSQCSKSDFEKTHSQKGYGQNCLEDISSTKKYMRVLSKNLVFL